MTPLTAADALEKYFLDARCRLLDLAAILDRIERGTGSATADPRLARIREALSTLLGPGPGRAAAIQTLFSQDYDPNWKRPLPR